MFFNANFGQLREAFGEGAGGGGSAAPASVEAMIGADLAGAGGGGALPTPDSAPVEPPAPTEGSEEPPVSQVQVEGVPPAEDPATSPTPGQPSPQESEGLKPEGVDVSDSRWQRMLGHNKYAREVAKALGIVDPDDTSPLDSTMLPPVEEVKAAFDSRGALEAMEADFLSPNPEDTRNLINQWNTLDSGAMQRFAAELPQVLASANPAAYQAVATPVIQRFIDYMYESAGAEQRPEIQKAILHGAQLAEWWATGGPQGGQFRPVEDIQRAIAQRQSDPLAAERQRLQAERAQIQQHYAKMAEAGWNNWRAETNKGIDQALDARIEEALAPLKAASPEAHYSAIKEHFLKQVHSRVQSNANGIRSFNIHYETAKRQFQSNPNVRDGLVNEYLRMAIPAVNALKAKFVTEQSQALVAQNQARLAQRQQAAQKVGPGAPGQPAPQSLNPALTQPRPGESHSEFMERLIRQDWQPQR